MPYFEAVVIGAGVVGLAAARVLAKRFANVAVVDRYPSYGMGTSSRNSEVIHAGIYYTAGSKKAHLCREGRKALYRYCVDRKVAHRQCGKIIVGSGRHAEGGLQAVKSKAEANGIDSLAWLGPADVARMEPEIACDVALHSPDTGIVDSHALMTAYAADIDDAGGVVALRTEVSRVELGTSHHKIHLVGEDTPVTAGRVVNAAGLQAELVARACEGLPVTCIPKLYFAKGIYLVPQPGRCHFKRLVYPLPDTASLGIHATIDIGGAVRFGPDVEWVDGGDDYTVDPERSAAFKRSISDYFPAIEDIDLFPAYAGIRPKLVGPGEPAADFRLDGPDFHGIPGLVNLFGIESPGLTASLAIADSISEMFP